MTAQTKKRREALALHSVKYLSEWKAAARGFGGDVKGSKTA